MSKVVIIGSGLGGLTCGYILQKNSYEVTVLEKENQIGGCLQCFSRHGVKFETGMHFIGSALPGQTMYGFMEYFGLLDTVKLSALDTDAYNTVSLDGRQYRFPNGREAFIERMASYFPHEKDGLVRYIEIIKRLSSHSTMGYLASGNRSGIADSEYLSHSINEVLESLFKDELLKKVLVGDLPLYAAEWDKTPFSLHAFIMDFYNQSAFRVVGGSDAIATSLADSIENVGGVICTGKKVRKIHCDNDKAVGVETEDEHFYPADFVIGAVHPKRLLEMLDTKLIRPAFRTRINGLSQTASVFALYIEFKDGIMPYMATNYYGYGCGTPWYCERYSEEEWPKAFLYMHLCHEDKIRWAKSGIVLAYMDIQDVAQWRDTTVGHRGASYEAFKQRYAVRLMDEVEKHFSGFKNSVQRYYTSTPLTYRDYTGTEDGAMYGVAPDVNLGSGGRVPCRTKVPNLLLAGQNINSHGILGVMVATMVTCAELVPVNQLYAMGKTTR